MSQPVLLSSLEEEEEEQHPHRLPNGFELPYRSHYPDSSSRPSSRPSSSSRRRARGPSLGKAQYLPAEPAAPPPDTIDSLLASFGSISHRPSTHQQSRSTAPAPSLPPSSILRSRPSTARSYVHPQESSTTTAKTRRESQDVTTTPLRPPPPIPLPTDHSRSSPLLPQSSPPPPPIPDDDNNDDDYAAAAYPTIRTARRPPDRPKEQPRSRSKASLPSGRFTGATTPSVTKPIGGGGSFSEQASTDGSILGGSGNSNNVQELANAGKRPSKPRNSLFLMRSRDSSRSRKKAPPQSDLPVQSPVSTSKPASVRAFSAQGSAYTSRPQTPTNEDRGAAAKPKSKLTSAFSVFTTTASPREHSPRTPDAIRSRRPSGEGRFWQDESGMVSAGPPRAVLAAKTTTTPQNGRGRSPPEPRKGKTIAEPDSSKPLPAAADGRPPVPSRSSSLRSKSRTALQRLKDSRRVQAEDKESISPESSRRPPQSLHSINSEKEAPRENEKAAVSEADRDSDVFRRIRELKEASARRRQEIARDDPYDLSSAAADSMQADLPRPPEATSAAAQLHEASKVQEHVVEPGSATRQSAATTVASSKDATWTHVQRVQTRPARSKAAATRPSLDVPQASHLSTHASPAVSRSNSKSRRFHDAELLPPPGLRSPKSMHSRQGSNASQGKSLYDPLPEGRLSTADSVVDEIHDYLDSPRLSHKIRSTHDPHRIISFSEVGDVHGHAVLCCVGMGLTRFVTAFYEELAVSLGLRLITPERPGIGESSAWPENTPPLRWPDDVADILAYLSIPHFSILAHSAGAIYGLATALAVPHLLRGPVHLLAPWIPPSQLASLPAPSLASSPADPSSKSTHSVPLSAAALPRSQRLLRLLPTSFFKLSALGNMAANATNGNPSAPSRPRRSTDSAVPSGRPSMARGESATPSLRNYFFSPKPSGRTSPTAFTQPSSTTVDELPAPQPPMLPSVAEEKARQKRYNQILTTQVWELSTRHSNPATDLLVCFERTRKIGFAYVDVRHRVVIHHGTKDARVPLDNVRCLARAMKDAELRTLEGEGHGLMSSAGVMGSVLTEIARTWDLNTASGFAAPEFADEDDDWVAPSSSRSAGGVHVPETVDEGDEAGFITPPVFGNPPGLTFR